MHFVFLITDDESIWDFFRIEFIFFPKAVQAIEFIKFIDRYFSQTHFRFFV